METAEARKAACFKKQAVQLEKKKRSETALPSQRLKSQDKFEPPAKYYSEVQVIEEKASIENIDSDADSSELRQSSSSPSSIKTSSLSGEESSKPGQTEHNSESLAVDSDQISTQ